LTSESDPVWTAASSSYVRWDAASTTNWDTAYSWGDWSGEGFITAADVPANETDAAALAKFGTIIDTKWCSASGTQIFCTQDAPAGGGVASLNSLDGALTLWGTDNQITVSASGTEGLVFATPQDIHTGASPTFTGLTLTDFAGFAKFTAGVLGTSTIGVADISDLATNYISTTTALSYLTTTTAASTYLGISASTTFAFRANNLSDLNSTATARTNLGLTDTATLASSTWLKVANNLSDLNNSSIARTNLGLAIGTNVQAYDAGLNSIAGLVTGADLMIYTTAADTYATTALTAFGRSLIDDAAASNARTTLGLDSMALLPNTGSTTITTLGTITTGTWSATAIANTKGGTGQDSSGWTGIPKVASGTWATTTLKFCFTVENPTSTDDNIPIWTPDVNITIVKQYCRTQGGTSTQITISDGTNDMEAITCDADGQADDGSLTNNTFSANERMEFDTGTVTGNVTWVNFCNYYTVD